MNDITRILAAADRDNAAAEQLLPLVYRELRALAARNLAREKPGQTLDATALVHEAYLRLLGPEAAGRAGQWDGRGHFFAAAAEAMRRILIENARRKSRLKRGGGRQRVDLDELELTVNDPQALAVSTSTADRDWAFARAWLYRRLAQDAGTPGPDRQR